MSGVLSTYNLIHYQFITLDLMHDNIVLYNYIYMGQYIRENFLCFIRTHYRGSYVGMGIVGVVFDRAFLKR